MTDFQQAGLRPAAQRPSTLRLAPTARPAGSEHAGTELAAPTARTGQGHDFSRVPVHAPATSMYQGTSKRFITSMGQPGPGLEAEKGMGSSGAGTIATSYVPESGDSSTKIVFIQVMQESLDGVPTKPGSIMPAFSYQDADTTDELYHVDYTQGEKDPYYNGDDPNDFGPQGNAVSTPKVTASTTDTPSLSDAGIPAGGTTVHYDFRTAAFSAAGDDAGTYYGYADWAFEKAKGVASTTSTKGTHSGGPGSKFESAVKLFNSNRGFKMPEKGLSLGGGILGGILGGIGGALLGLLIGGVPGAVIGGIAGAAGGAAVGAGAFN